jgi:preprotein translocase subunit SecD
MRRWWDRLFVLAIAAIAGLAIYAVWPDEPDRYFPDWMDLPSGRGVPSRIAGVNLPCRSTDTSDTNPARDCKGMILGLDLQGGSRITLQADLQGQTDIDLDDAMNGAKEIIESRVNPFGVSESLVQRAGDDRLIVELPGVSADTARDITRPAVLMFCEPLQEGGRPGVIQGGAASNIATHERAAEVYYKPGTCEPDVDPATGQVALAAPDNPDGSPGGLMRNEAGEVERIAPNYTQAIGSSRAQIIWTPALGELDGAPTVMTGSFLESNARVDPDQFGSFANPYLVFNMTGDGEDVFGSLTKRIQPSGESPGLPLSTFLDGEPVRGKAGEIIAPSVEAEIRDTGVTTGLSLTDAKRLRTFLNNGAFPIPLRVIQQQDVDASLGDEAVLHSVQAGIVALLVVMAFMTLYYRLPGVLASIALVVYTAVVLAVFKIGIPGSGPVTLTLAGIAAFVLSVGMAVDANILIFERTKEELRNGRSLIPSVEAGFDRAWSSIRDSNISTMITCGILYWMGDAFASSLIKGFALTLAIGVIVSLFSAITVTRTLLRLAIGTPLRHALWLWTDDKREDQVPARARVPEVAEAADA